MVLCWVCFGVFFNNRVEKLRHFLTQKYQTFFSLTPVLKHCHRAVVPDVTGFHRPSTTVHAHAQLNGSCVQTLLLNPATPQLQSVQAYPGKIKKQKNQIKEQNTKELDT